MKKMIRTEIFTNDCPDFKVDHTKQNYKYFTATERVGWIFKSKKKYPVYKANCKACNQEVLIPAPRLTASEYKSCGCSRKLTSEEVYNQEINTPAFKRYVAKIKKGAAERKYEFNLTDDLIYKLNKSNCYYCGVAPERIFKSCEARRYVFNGIDRVNNNFGYVKENVVSCCFDCNSMKSILNKELFLNKIEAIYNNLINPGKFQ